MSALASAVAASFRDRNLAADALYRPGGIGSGFPCRAVLSAGDHTGNFGKTRIVSDSVLLSLQIADAPSLTPGDTLEIGGSLYRILGAPVRDATRLVWTAEAREL